MALHKGRKLEFMGTTYHWAITPRTKGWTPKVLKLTIQDLSGGAATQFTCTSRRWTDQDEYDQFEGGAAFNHKVPFGPGHVRQIIEHGPEGCNLDDWKVQSL
jgi:hypothetical protein